jgi:hypothetical protein
MPNPERRYLEMGWEEEYHGGLLVPGVTGPHPY